MVKRVVIVWVWLIATVGVALATHPGSVSGYALVGFTGDSKYVYFRKSQSVALDGEQWLAVYDASTGKLKTSQPVSRTCEGECDRGQPIDDKTGAKIEAKLHAAHGAPVAATKLATKATTNAVALRDARKAGHLQVFTATGVEVRATTKLAGKLPDLDESDGGTASFDLEVTVIAGGSRWAGKHRVRAESVDDPDNGNLSIWPELYIQELAVAPDRRALALVFGRRPWVVTLTATKP